MSGQWIREVFCFAEHGGHAWTRDGDDAVCARCSARVELTPEEIKRLDTRPEILASHPQTPDAK